MAPPPLSSNTRLGTPATLHAPDSRSPSRTGLRDEKALAKAVKMSKKQQFKMNKFGKASESDRRIAIKKPKHLFSGKRGNGKTDRR